MLWFANSTKGFGFVKVRGRKRVPNPPTKISAFRPSSEAAIVE